MKKPKTLEEMTRREKAELALELMFWAGAAVTWPVFRPAWLVFCRKIVMTSWISDREAGRVFATLLRFEKNEWSSEKIDEMWELLALHRPELFVQLSALLGS